MSSAKESKVTLGDIKSGLDSVDNKKDLEEIEGPTSAVLRYDSRKFQHDEAYHPSIVQNQIEKKDRMVSKKLYAVDKRILALGGEDQLKDF